MEVQEKRAHGRRSMNSLGNASIGRSLILQSRVFIIVDALD